LNEGYDISNRHMKKNIHQKCLKLAMKHKGNVSGKKTSKMSAKICKITFLIMMQTANIIVLLHK
jgi:hypothetical protein